MYRKVKKGKERSRKRQQVKLLAAEATGLEARNWEYYYNRLRNIDAFLLQNYEKVR